MVFVCRSPLSFPKLLILHLLINAVLSMFSLYISANNYPGGEALRAVNAQILSDVRERNINQVSVYVSDLAAQSGSTRFLELDRVYYNKEPKFVANQFELYELVYLVIEPVDRRLYFDGCTDSLPDQSICQLATNSSTTNRFECHWRQNITAFDRIDFKQLRVNFRTFLNIYRCHKMTVSSI